MTVNDFFNELKADFPFKEEDDDFLFVDLPVDKVLAYNQKIQIKAINYLKINNDTLGFSMDRILDLESSNELLLISGTQTKDGLYYLDHESSLITVEELETDESTEEWIADWMNVDLEDYSKLEIDEKVALFEKETGIYRITETLEQFIEDVAIVSGEDL